MAKCRTRPLARIFLSISGKHGVMDACNQKKGCTVYRNVKGARGEVLVGRGDWVGMMDRTRLWQKR